MNNNDILSIMQSKAGSFSKGQRLLARYITESYDKAAFYLLCGFCHLGSDAAGEALSGGQCRDPAAAAGYW